MVARLHRRRACRRGPRLPQPRPIELAPIDAIVFEHVTKRYRKTGPPALEDISFSIPVGSRTCLLGPNGAGKSTAIRLLQGALRPTRGNVALLSAAVDSAAYLAARQRTGIVPQGPGMYRDLTTREYLTLARDLYGRGDLAQTVHDFGLADHVDKRMTELSGGYQRRVVLAAALLADPELLLLDEPTVGLDPLATHDVREILSRAMHTPSRTTLLCTHNLAEAEALCDDVVILRDGHVLVHAPLANLRQRTHARVRLRARHGSEALRAALSALECTSEPDPDTTDGALITVTNPTVDVPPILRRLLDDGLDVYACEPLDPGLEAVFLDLVRGA